LLREIRGIMIKKDVMSYLTNLNKSYSILSITVKRLYYHNTDVRFDWISMKNKKEEMYISFIGFSVEINPENLEYFYEMDFYPKNSLKYYKDNIGRGIVSLRFIKRR